MLRAGVRKILMNHLVRIYYKVIILWNKILKKECILYSFMSSNPGLIAFLESALLNSNELLHSLQREWAVI